MILKLSQYLFLDKNMKDGVMGLCWIHGYLMLTTSDRFIILQNMTKTKEKKNNSNNNKKGKLCLENEINLDIVNKHAQKAIDEFYDHLEYLSMDISDIIEYSSEEVLKDLKQKNINVTPLQLENALFRILKQQIDSYFKDCFYDYGK